MMSSNQGVAQRIVTLQRDCAATLVPTGTDISIPKDTFVTLTQSLGDSYTVLVNGNMARIDGTDADALGMKPLQIACVDDGSGKVNEDNLWNILCTVYDPEIPVNLVDLGLIYSCSVDRQADENIVKLIMTLTTPGCGMGPVLVGTVRHRLALAPNVDRVDVDLVFDPPWNRNMMSEVAQLELGMF